MPRLITASRHRRLTNYFSSLHHNNSAALAWGKYGCVALSFLFSRDHIRVLPLTVSRVPVVVPFPLFFCSRCRFGSPVDVVHELQGWLAQTAYGDMGLVVDP